MDWTTLLVAVISLFGGGALVQLLRLKSERTKILSEAKLADANTAQVLSAAAATQIQIMQEFSSKRIAELETQISLITEKYELKIQLLTDQIIALNREIARLRREGQR